MRPDKIKATEVFLLGSSVLIGIQGIVHGISGIQKGSTPTGGMLLPDIGAITLIQNYLYTGLAAAVAGLAIILWTFFFLRNRFFTPVFAMLCAVLLLTGGGVAFVIFFFFALAASFQLKRPSGFALKMLSGKAGDALSALWPALMAVSFGCAMTGMLIWLFLIPPGIEHEITWIQYACWAFLAAGLIGFFPALFASIARDIKEPKTGK